MIAGVSITNGMCVEKMYLCKKRTRDYSMVFTASFENVDLVCRDIDEFLKHYGLISLSFIVELGARETINNAIIHGSQNDSNKEITFRIYQDDNCLYLQTVDQGKGFPPVYVKHQGGDTPSESGRGLAILHEYFDSVILKGIGNGIILELNTHKTQKAQE